MSNSTEPAPAKPIATWRKVLAAIFDFLMVFFVFGYIIGYFAGGLTDKGFNLTGWPALLLMALVVAYFVIFRKFLGGTIWQRIFGAR